MPGSSQRMLDKSRSLAADCVAYDLEDSVTPSRKAEARAMVRNAINQEQPASIKERAVRINSVGSGLAYADLKEVVCTFFLFFHTPVYEKCGTVTLWILLDMLFGIISICLLLGYINCFCAAQIP